jgi:large subunit ribosomal protein L29
MSRPDELRELDEEELLGRLVDSRKELFNLRFQLATGRLDNISRITVVRREIARLLTIQRANEIEAAEQLAVSTAGGAGSAERKGR